MLERGDAPEPRCSQNHVSAPTAPPTVLDRKIPTITGVRSPLVSEKVHAMVTRLERDYGARRPGHPATERRTA